MRDVAQMLAVTTLATACAVVLSVAPPSGASATAPASKAVPAGPVPAAANRGAQCHIARRSSATA